MERYEKKLLLKIQDIDSVDFSNLEDCKKLRISPKGWKYTTKLFFLPFGVYSFAGVTKR
jgi:hypothetical protein